VVQVKGNPFEVDMDFTDMQARLEALVGLLDER
jgi:hypothetical protein